MFEGPHATNIFGDSSFRWWSPPVSLDRGGRVRRSRCILLGWRGFLNVSLIHHECCKSFECFFDFFHLGFRLLFVVFNFFFREDELIFRLVLCLVGSFWNFEV